MTRLTAKLVLVFLLLLAFAPCLSAQAPPQVVTVVQRLSGLQALSMQREAGDGAITRLENAELLMSCHWVTNVTAGLLLDDGKSVLVYLAHVPEKQLQNARCPASEALSIYDAAGQNLIANFVGLDARTGLSLLQTVGTPAPVIRSAQPVTQQSILIYAPQPLSSAPFATSGRVALKLGPMETRLQEITRTSDGQTVDFLLSGLGLTPALIGGVAVKKGELSEILGLVTNVLPTQARILPLPAALLAAARIRAHNHNVPRPWLGITAQEIAGFPPAEWNRLFPSLAQPKEGLILTGVLPETPAARAGLRTGDFLLKVNDKPLTNINDFSYLLAQSEAGDTITLQAQRGLASENLTLSVRLGATNETHLPRPRQMAPDILSTLGMVSLSLAPAVAKTLRSAGGRVILSVEEASAAGRAGLQAGDIIEQINGNQITRLSATPSAPGKLTLTVLRQGKRLKRIILLP